MSEGDEGPRIRGWGSRPLVALPEREKTQRLTLDFTGPMLPLPSAVPPAGPLPQELTPKGHDAWAVDHVRRSTPPPMQVTPGWLETGLERTVRASTVPPPPPTPVPAEPAAGSALDLVEHARPSLSGVDLHQEMADRFALGDFSGALGVAELILGTKGDDPSAVKYAASCREKLEQLYVSRLGSLATRLAVKVKGGDIRWLGLDHRAGFLLSRIEPAATVEDIIDMCGMPRLEALRTLGDLLDLAAIEIVVDDGRRRR